MMERVDERPAIAEKVRKCYEKSVLTKYKDARDYWPVISGCDFNIGHYLDYWIFIYVHTGSNAYGYKYPAEASPELLGTSQITQDNISLIRAKLEEHYRLKKEDAVFIVKKDMSNLDSECGAAMQKHEYALGLNPIRLFISHCSNDQEVAGKLTELVKNALRLSSSEIRCTSVDGYRLPGGAKTNEQIKREVRDSIAFIGLISAAATGSMYVLFELGARWGSDKHLLPLLAPGVSPDILKGPLSELNALSCANSSQLHQLVSDLAKILKIQPETADVYQRYIDGILAIPPSLDKTQSGGDQVDVAPAYKLTDVQLRILKAVADTKRREATVARIAKLAGLSDMEAEYNLNELSRKLKLLSWQGNINPHIPCWYVLTHEGQGFLLRQTNT